LAAEIRAISLGEKLRDDETVEKLTNVALSRIGLFSLWATLVDLISLSWRPVPDELTIINTLGVYATLGALIGFTLCLYESWQIYWSSLKLMRASGMDTASFLMCIKVPDSFCLVPVVVTAYNLFRYPWVTELSVLLFVYISVRPISEIRGSGQSGSVDEANSQAPKRLPAAKKGHAESEDGLAASNCETS
jgi:hypothetical protein